MTRNEFAKLFSCAGGYDIDLVASFISDLDSINGILPSEASEVGLMYNIRLNGNGFALLSFCIIDNHPVLLFSPAGLRRFLEDNGVFPFEATDFIDLCMCYADKTCDQTEKLEAVEDCYLDIQSILNNQNQLIQSVRRFVSELAAK